MILHVKCCTNQWSHVCCLVNDHSFPMGRPTRKSERGKPGLGMGWVESLPCGWDNRVIALGQWWWEWAVGEKNNEAGEQEEGDTLGRGCELSGTPQRSKTPWVERRHVKGDRVCVCHVEHILSRGMAMAVSNTFQTEPQHQQIRKPVTCRVAIRPVRLSVCAVLSWRSQWLITVSS